MFNPKVYTPDQVAELLQLSTNTIYKLIDEGEIVAKRLGNVYRVPQASLSFVFTGLDEDLLAAQKEDEKVLPRVREGIRKTRAAKKL